MKIVLIYIISTVMLFYGLSADSYGVWNMISLDELAELAPWLIWIWKIAGNYLNEKGLFGAALGEVVSVSSKLPRQESLVTIMCRFYFYSYRKGEQTTLFLYFSPVTIEALDTILSAKQNKQLMH